MSQNGNGSYSSTSDSKFRWLELWPYSQKCTVVRAMALMELKTRHGQNSTRPVLSFSPLPPSIPLPPLLPQVFSFPPLAFCLPFKKFASPGTKQPSPMSRAEWKPFRASAIQLRAPYWIIDIRRFTNGYGGIGQLSRSAKPLRVLHWNMMSLDLRMAALAASGAHQSR